MWDKRGNIRTGRARWFLALGAPLPRVFVLCLAAHRTGRKRSSVLSVAKGGEIAGVRPAGYVPPVAVPRSWLRAFAVRPGSGRGVPLPSSAGHGRRALFTGSGLRGGAAAASCVTPRARKGEGKNLPISITSHFWQTQEATFSRPCRKSPLPRSPRFFCKKLVVEK